MWPASFSDASIASAARATCAPGRGHAHGRAVDSIFHRQPHQMVPCRMEFDLVAPPPVAVVRLQHRRTLIRLHAPLDRLRGTGLAPVLFELRAGPAGAFARHRLAQRAIRGEQIVAGERRRLVQNSSSIVLILHPARHVRESIRRPATFGFRSSLPPSVRLWLRKL